LKKTDLANRKEKGRKREETLPKCGAAAKTNSLRIAPSLNSILAPSQVAATCGIRLIYEKLPLAFGRVIYLAEASLQPPRISVNTTAIAKLAECAAQVPAEQRPWFTAAIITEVVVAHELYHILAQQASSPAVEARAHEFAQALTGLPFSPHIYEMALKQAARCWNTTNII
jgi:hypothetical protein